MFNHVCLVWLAPAVIALTTHTTTTSIYPRLALNDTELQKLYERMEELDNRIVSCCQREEYAFTSLITALNSIEHYNSILAIIVMEMVKNRWRDDVKQFASTVVNIGYPKFFRMNISSFKAKPTNETVIKFQHLYNETENFFRSIKERL